MEKKSFRDVSSGIQSSYKKAKDSILKGSIDYGVELLKGIVKKEPAFIEAREELRKHEKARTAEMGGFAKFMAGIKMAGSLAKGKAVIGKKPLEAMKHAEDALMINLKSLAALTLLMDAADAAEAPFIAIEAMEIAQEYFPENETVLRNLQYYYKLTKQGNKMLAVVQQIVKMHPNDLDAEAELRSAAAMAAMEKGKWEEDGDYRDKMKSEEDAVAIEQEDRIARNVDDMKEIIERYEKQIAEGDESVDLRRKLADYYYRYGRFEDSINTYNWIAEKMGTLDIAIDRAIEKSNVGIYDRQIKELTEQGADEPQIQEVQQQRYNYRYERAEDRVARYPNDNELHYNFAVVCWEGQQINKALEHFQIGQKNPHLRLSAIVYLGRCFDAKGQNDMAVEQFDKALAEMPVVNKQKMEALYYLGDLYDRAGDVEKAIKCFKEIYQADIGYRDVSERMEEFYRKQKENSE